MQRSLKQLLHDDYFDLIDENASNFVDFKAKFFDQNKRTKFYLRQIVEHRFYDYLMSFVVVLSSITLGLSLETDETYLNDHWRQNLISAADEILLSILFLEFLLKFSLESFRYWTNWANLYDFSIILLGFIEILSTFFSEKKTSTMTNVFKGLRLFQLIRLYRILKFSEGLRILSKALLKTVLTYTFSVLILVFLIVYVVAVVGQMLYGRSETSPWHFFSTSMIISTRLILVDNWNIIGPELEEKGSPTISRWFLVIVVFIGNRLVANVLVGLMIESVSSANDEFLKEKREEKLFRHQLKREELSQKTIEVLNTRLSSDYDRFTTNENLLEKMKNRLKFTQNESISVADLLFSTDWLEKLICSSEKTQIEARAIRQEMINLIGILAEIIDENEKILSRRPSIFVQ